MQFGVAARCVTPDRPIYLSGYASRDSKSEGVYQDLFVKALAIRDGDAGLAVIVTSDLLYFDAAILDPVEERLAREAGLRPAQLFLTASHTHCGPIIRQKDADLYGKLANISADIAGVALRQVDLFKRLVGEDRIAAERKYTPAFDFWSYARLLFSGQEIPPTPDASHAYSRRWQILRFPHTFNGRPCSTCGETHHTDERLLERRTRERKAEAQIWEEKAAQALDAGEEDLARRALERKVTILTGVEEMDSALEEARQITTQLKQQLVQFRQKLEEARSRQRSLVARHRAAQDPGRPMTPSTEAFDRYDRMCQEVERREAAAEVFEEMAGSSPGLEADFARLEKRKRVEQELQTLKDRQGSAEA